MFTKEQILLELQKIQSSIPACYTKNVVKEKPVTPTIKKVVELAMKENLPDWKKERLQTILDSGELDATAPTENPRIVKQINAWVDKKIKEAIKAKRLPSKRQLKKILYDKETTNN